ncbi:MAG: hypothetical protein ACJ75H_17110 [Thermoanaerobaculia bacterium]
MREISRFRLGLALTLVPVMGQFLVVAFLGVNTPVADELFFTRFIHRVHEGKGWLPLVWAQHNEHRIVPVRLTMAFLEPFVGWSPRAEMYVSAVLAGLVVLGLWRLYRRAGGADLLIFAPAAWLFCNLAQYENMLYGLQMCHYFTALGIVWALVFLARGSAPGIGLAALSGFTASVSILNGFLVWPAGLFLLLARRERWGRIAAWCLAGAATSVLFFLGYVPPAGIEALHPGWRDLPRVAAYVLALLGSPLAGGSQAWAVAAGLAPLAVALALGLAWARWGKERMRDDALPVSLLLFGLLSALMIAAGRALTGIPPLQSRYVIYSALGIIGVYLLAARSAERSRPLASPWLAAALALLIPGVIASDLQGYAYAKLWRAARVRDQYYFQTFELQPDEVFGNPKVAEWLRLTGPYLRRYRLGAFSEPLHLLVPVRMEEPAAAGLLAAGPLVAGKPVELRLACPVDTLWDMAVAMSREGPPEGSSLSVSLWAGGRRLGVRELPSVTLASGWVGWVRIPLDEPLKDCEGRALALRIESPDATPEGKVTMWTYPRYYQSDLRQAGATLAPGRSLGITLNGYHHGLMQ